MFLGIPQKPLPFCSGTAVFSNHPRPLLAKEGPLFISLSGERNETKREGENGPELGARLSDFRNHSKNALRFNGISYFVPQAAAHPETQ